MTEFRIAALRCLERERNALDRLIGSLDEAFDHAVEAIDQCSGRVHTTGVGKSFHVAAKFADCLNTIGIPGCADNPTDLLHGGIGGFTENDLLLMISRSGETEELLQLSEAIRSVQPRIPCIGILCCKGSALERFTNPTIVCDLIEEADPLGIVPTASTIVCSAVGDALISALIQKRHVTRAQFARNHPGGTLGRLLR